MDKRPINNGKQAKWSPMLSVIIRVVNNTSLIPFHHCKTGIEICRKTITIEIILNDAIGTFSLKVYMN